jgi:hypothetical protein
MLVCEPDELDDRPVLRHGIRVGDEDVLAARRGHAGVHVLREAAWTGILEHARSRRHRADATRQVRDHEQLVDLRREGGQGLLELARVPVRDDDGRDLQESTSR